MKKLIFLGLMLLCAQAFAQIDTNGRGRGAIMNGKSANRIIGGEVANMTDKNVYDIEGNILDSVTVTKMLRTYDYRAGLSRVKGQEGLRRAVMPIDPTQEEFILKAVLRSGKPTNPKLQIGEVLDLSPLKRKVDLDKLNGKAIVLIFWCGNCYPNPQKSGYEEINYITGKFAKSDKFKVIAVTHLAPFEAEPFLKKLPILNAQLIYNGVALTDAYETNNRSLILITDKDHKITYATKNWATTTDRFLYKSLEGL